MKTEIKIWSVGSCVWAALTVYYLDGTFVRTDYAYEQLEHMLQFDDLTNDNFHKREYLKYIILKKMTIYKCLKGIR